MDYLRTKKQLLELKLDLVHFEILKSEYLEQQHFEKYALMRDEVQRILAELDKHKEHLLNEIHLICSDFSNEISKLKKMEWILNLLFELPNQQNPSENSILKRQVMDSVHCEYIALWKQHKQMMRECRFGEAAEVQKQALSLGQFIMKNG
jgi:hypothetical protein